MDGTDYLNSKPDPSINFLLPWKQYRCCCFSNPTEPVQIRTSLLKRLSQGGRKNHKSKIISTQVLRSCVCPTPVLTEYMYFCLEFSSFNPLKLCPNSCWPILSAKPIGGFRVAVWAGSLWGVSRRSPIFWRIMDFATANSICVLTYLYLLCLPLL